MSKKGSNPPPPKGVVRPPPPPPPPPPRSVKGETTVRMGYSIPMPQNADQAELMQKLGYAWLQENAPERLARQNQRGAIGWLTNAALNGLRRGLPVKIYATDNLVAPGDHQNFVYLRPPTQPARTPERWVTLEDLPAGSLFETQDGIKAVKSEYRYSNSNAQPQCILLESGEYAHFEHGADTLVRPTAEPTPAEPNQ